MGLINNIYKLFKSDLFWLIIIIIIAFYLRLYKLDSPVADWHSWRQADTAAVSRNFYKATLVPPLGERLGAFDFGYFLRMIFIPRFDDMAPMGTDLPNVNRYRFVEFPIYNIFVYLFYLLSGGVDEKFARLTSVLMSLGSVVFLYLIVRKYFDKLTAFVSALVFAMLPFNVYFSRVILPEPTLVFLSLGMFYFVDRWIWEEKRGLYIASVIFTALAFLVKPMAVFYLLPLLYSYYNKEKHLFPVPKRYYLWLILSFLPFLGWRVWMSYFPEGIPAASWLFNGNGIRFRPAFWRWILGDRFGREILSVAGTFLFFLGLLLRTRQKESYLLHLLAASSLLFLVVFATGNVTHDYYQTLIIPALAIFVARGFVFLLRGVPSFLPRILTAPFAILLFVLTFYFGWYEVKGFYQINNGSIVEAGEAVDRLIPKEALVIAPYGGDTAFLYQTNRPGWAMAIYPVDELIEKFGATHYVSVNYDDLTNEVVKKYKILERNPRYVIIDLREYNPDWTPSVIKK